MEIYQIIMNTPNSITDLNNSTMDIHNSAMDMSLIVGMSLIEHYAYGQHN